MLANYFFYTLLWNPGKGVILSVFDNSLFWNNFELQKWTSGSLRGLGKGLEKGRGVLGVGFRGKGVFGEGSGRVGKGLGGDVGDGPAEWDRASLIYSYNHTYICIYIYTHINPSSLVFLPIYVFP